MKSTLLPLLAGTTIFAACSFSQAALLVYEGFDYTGGTSLGATTNGGTGWDGAWSVTSGSAPVVDAAQLSPVGSLATSGRSVTQSSAASANSVTRSFTDIGTGVTSSSPETVWMSFEMQGNGNNSNDSYLALMRNSGSGAGDEIIRVGRKSGVSGGQITLSSAAGTTPAQTSFGNIAYNTNIYFMLVKIDLQRSGAGTGANVYTASLWSFTNTIPTSEGSLGTSQANFTTSVLGFGTGLDQVRLFDASTGANSTFDEIRIGTTFADVTPIPEPATLAFVVGGLAGLAVVRRRRKR